MNIHLKMMSITALVGMIAPTVADAADCRVVHWRPGEVIDVRASIGQGSRIQFPSDLIGKPQPGNQDLWLVDSAATQMIVAPKNPFPQGERTNIHPMTTDGNVFDITLIRAPLNKQDECVLISMDGPTFSPDMRQQMARAVSSQNSNIAIQDLAEQIQSLKSKAESERQSSVMDALRRYRYHIYTRYKWSPGKGWGSKYSISDIYDDGRFTYIRMASPDSPTLSVETVVGNKKAIVPTTYDATYGIYVVTGIYPTFILRRDDEKITISRGDDSTNGRG